MEQEKKSGYVDILLIVLFLLTLSGLSVFFDTEITRNRRSEFVAGDFRRIIQLSEIFAHGFGIAIVLYLLWVLSPQNRRWIPRICACAILPGLVVQLFKLFVVRRRPGFYYPDFADKVADTWIGVFPDGVLNLEYATSSFPSAHAATAVGLAVGLIWLFHQARHIFIVLAVLSSFQRVVAGAHWTSDVFAGAAVSVLVCGIVFRNRRINSMFARFENRPLVIANTTSSEIHADDSQTNEVHDSARKVA